MTPAQAAALLDAIQLLAQRAQGLDELDKQNDRTFVGLLCNQLNAVVTALNELNPTESGSRRFGQIDPAGAAIFIHPGEDVGTLRIAFVAGRFHETDDEEQLPSAMRFAASVMNEIITQHPDPEDADTDTEFDD